MKKRLIIILVLIVLLPLAVLVHFGVALAQREQERTESRYKQVLSGRLQDINSGITKLVESGERELLQALELPSFDAELIRGRIRTERLLRQIFILDADGRLIYPDKNDLLTNEEQKFLERTASLWENGEAFWMPAEKTVQQKAYQSISLIRRRRQDFVRPAPSYGWHTWFWGEGLRLIFWQRQANGYIIGTEVERAAMIADVIGQLPSADYSRTPLPDGRIVLVDAQNRTLYQWGSFVPADDESYAVTLPAPAPFTAWTFRYYVAAAAAGNALGGSAVFNIVSGLAVLTLALIALAVYFYRESSRDMREASRRVTFVNQVSHELKTPLTNIRMYAELLEKRLPDDDPHTRGYIEILVAETGRLSRLISNVLTFAKQRRDKLKLHLQPAIVDDVIKSVAASFTPALDALNIKVEHVGSAGRSVALDVDKLEQILGNLINNVEKYAAGATTLRIERRQDEASTTIIIADDGSGIPQEQRERIFRPFERLSNRLTDGVSGTGIGLSIARQLARLHGGDLILLPVNGGGAVFELRLRTTAG
jgi:signal transduction histidine kinase